MICTGSACPFFRGNQVQLFPSFIVCRDTGVKSKWPVTNYTVKFPLLTTAEHHLQSAQNVPSFHTRGHLETKIFTDRSLTLRMGVGAAGFSSTWSLIDPLIAGIGHRAMTPATPPGFQSDGTLFRQKSVDVSFPKGCALDVWRAFISEWLLVWQTSERTSTTITENPTCSCWSSEARRKEEQILQVTNYITAVTIMSHSCWNKLHFMISLMFRSYFISHFLRTGVTLSSISQISHFGMRHFLFVVVAENEFAASELHH